MFSWPLSKFLVLVFCFGLFSAHVFCWLPSEHGSSDVFVVRVLAILWQSCVYLLALIVPFFEASNFSFYYNFVHSLLQALRPYVLSVFNNILRAIALQRFFYVLWRFEYVQFGKQRVLLFLKRGLPTESDFNYMSKQTIKSTRRFFTSNLLPLISSFEYYDDSVRSNFLNLDWLYCT